jgi:NAD-dependent dihydropyrimidine dehydrogenase PreA subunit
MDGIMAMEGNGPRSGKPKKLSVLLLSTDPIAIDATACRIIDLDPEVVPTSRPGEQAGLGTYHAENIEIVGENMEQFLNQTFDVIRTPPMHCTSGRLRTFIKNRICEKPVVDEAKCTNCGTCVRMCPVKPKAIDWHTGDTSKPPAFRYDLCIRCYCCQETCPEGAILLEAPVLSRLLQRV